MIQSHQAFRVAADPKGGREKVWDKCDPCYRWATTDLTHLSKLGIPIDVRGGELCEAGRPSGGESIWGGEGKR